MGFNSTCIASSFVRQLLPQRPKKLSPYLPAIPEVCFALINSAPFPSDSTSLLQPSFYAQISPPAKPISTILTFLNGMEPALVTL